MSHNAFSPRSPHHLWSGNKSFISARLVVRNRLVAMIEQTIFATETKGL